MEKSGILAWFGFGDPHGSQASDLYGRVVTAAREPGLYRLCGVPDTPDGRYEMVIVHLVVLLERLKAGAPATDGLSRRLAETFVTDMDDCLREMGVGDLTVPKKVRRAAAGLYERARGYRAVDGAGVERVAALAGALSASIPGLGRPEELSRYVIAADAALAGQSLDDIVAGRVSFPGVTGAG